MAGLRMTGGLTAGDMRGSGGHVPGLAARPGILLCFATLILLTGLQYWFGPAWRIRRRRLRPAVGEVHDELRRMAEEVLGSRRAVFLLDALNPAVAGQAFGRIGRRYVVISQGTWLLFERDRSLFRAVVLHELAHVRNRDLDITAVTLAIWRTYAVMILVPGLLAALIGVVAGQAPFQRPEQMPFGLDVMLSWVSAAQITGLAVLSWLTRSVVLQSRELMADARVLSWQQDATPLHRLFEKAPAARRWPVSLRVRTHPNIAIRRAALDDQAPLVRQCLLMLVPMAARLATLGRRPSAPRPKGRVGLALACAAAAAVITVNVSHTVNGYIYEGVAPPLLGLIAAGAAVAAALAAAVAALSGTSPVAKGMVAGLAVAVLYALVLQLVGLPMPWLLHMLILERMLEAALIAGLATALLARLLPVRADPDLL